MLLFIGQIANVWDQHRLRDFRTGFLCFKENLVLVLVKGARLIALFEASSVFCNCIVGRAWAVVAFYVNLWMRCSPLLQDVLDARRGALLLVKMARLSLVPPVMVVFLTHRQNLSSL